MCVCVCHSLPAIPLPILLKHQLSSIDGGRERDLKEEVEEWRERYQNLTEKVRTLLQARLRAHVPLQESGCDVFSAVYCVHYYNVELQ